MGQYFDNDNLPSNIKEHNVKIFNNEYVFCTDNGVFSKDGLDFGTRLLLESLPISLMHGDALDLGCGYGVVSIILSKVTDLNFDGVDVNLRALHLCEMNVKRNHSQNVNFFMSNAYENVNKKYDYIITNPPIRAGKDVVYDFLFNAKDHLKENGVLYFVIRKEQGAKSCIKDMSLKANIEVVNKKSGFFIIKCIFN